MEEEKKKHEYQELVVAMFMLPFLQGYAQIMKTYKPDAYISLHGRFLLEGEVKRKEQEEKRVAASPWISDKNSSSAVIINVSVEQVELSDK